MSASKREMEGELGMRGMRCGNERGGQTFSFLEDTLNGAGAA